MFKSTAVIRGLRTKTRRQLVDVTLPGGRAE